MVNYVDEIMARVHLTVVGQDNLERILNKHTAKLNKLGADSRRMATQARLALESSLNESQGLLGKIFSPQFAKKNLFMREIDSTFKEVFNNAGTAASKGFSQSLIDSPFDVGDKLPTPQDIMKGLKGEASGINQYKDLGFQLQDLANRGHDVTAQMKLMNSQLKEGSSDALAFSEGIKQANEQAKQMKNRFDMNTLSFLFAGMAMRQLGMSMLRFVLPAMDQIEGYNSRGLRQVNAMKASYEFLKFSIFETFTQTPLFQKFVDVVIQGANWLSEMVVKYPIIVQIAATVGAIAVAFGTMAMAAGIYGQIAHVIKLLGIGGLLGKLTAIKGALSVGMLGKLFGAGLIAKAGLDLYNYATGQRTLSWGNMIMTAITTGLGAGIWTMNPMVGVLAGTTMLVSLVVASKRAQGQLQHELRQIALDAGETLTMSDYDAGSLNRDAQTRLVEKGMGIQLTEYQKLINRQMELNSLLQDQETIIAKGSSYLSDLRAESSNVSLKMSEIEQLAAGMGNQFEKDVRWLQSKYQAHLEFESLLEQQLADQIEQERMLRMQEDAQKEVLSQIAMSKEETQLFTNNMSSLLKVMTGATMDTAVGYIVKIDETMLSADRHFVEFRNKLEEWASKVTTKIVEIQYRERSAPSSGGFLSSSGASRAFVSSDSTAQNFSPAQNSIRSPFTGGSFVPRSS